jgi:hypothetical protein
MKQINDFDLVAVGNLATHLTLKNLHQFLALA